MPSIIHLPVYGQHLMKIPLWDWQSRICLDIIHQRKIGGVLSDGECKQLLMLDMIKSSHYPMLNTHADPIDRKSTRLNSSHVSISYAVFCLKKKIANIFY